MNVELRQIRHAVTVAALGSFARAAAELNLSQSALSRSVQALERQVGTPLFVRSANGVLTTDVGRLFLERGKGLLDMAEELDLQVLRNRGLQRGRIVVGAGPVAMDLLVAEAAAAFITEHPMVTVELRSASLLDLPAPLRSREIDLLVARDDYSRNEPDVDVERLNDHPMLLVGRTGHPLAGRRDLTLQETFDYPWLAIGRIPRRSLDFLMRAQHAAPSTTVRRRAFPAMQCASVSVARQAMQLSDGLTLLTPAMARVSTQNGQTAPLMSLAGKVESNNALIRLKSRPLSAAARIFCEKLRTIDQRHADQNAQLLQEWFG